MYIKIIINTLLMIILTLVQISFISGLPSWLSNLNIVIVVLIMILGFRSFRSAIMWSLVVGFFWDMYSFSLFGLNMISLVLAMLAANFLLVNFLTNRSLYTFLMLTLVATFIFELINITAAYVFIELFNSVPIFSFSGNFWMDELIKILVNMGLSLLLFYIVSFFSKKFKPMFLIR